MDICSEALRGETTGRLVAEATTPATGRPVSDELRRRDAARTSSALRAAAAAAAPYVLGDLSGLATWFWMSRRSERRGAEEVFDVAA